MPFAKKLAYTYIELRELFVNFQFSALIALKDYVVFHLKPDNSKHPLFFRMVFCLMTNAGSTLCNIFSVHITVSWSNT